MMGWYKCWRCGYIEQRDGDVCPSCGTAYQKPRRAAEKRAVMDAPETVAVVSEAADNRADGAEPEPDGGVEAPGDGENSNR